ncbi:MAG: nucleoside-binding protein [Colwellia sp.]|nr:nucleoside-binding protein [Colwellia sp.]
MRIVYCLLLVMFSNSVYAETLWSDYSVTYLQGSHYEVGDENRKVVTFEYVSGTSWGDHFMFVDNLHSDNGDVEIYGEFSPRFKLMQLDSDVITNLYIATTVEMGAFSGASGYTSNVTNYLVGLGVDVKIPYFNFFKVNVYHRNNEHGDNNYQTTLAWAMPLGPLYYDGFIDYATSNDDNATSINFTSQLKYDLASLLGLSSKLYLGIEYVYWQNKFGIDGVDEKNANLLVKYHF